jgi:hypothetical protein
MSEPTVYLAGPVAAYDDGGAGWRADIEQTYGDRCEFKNPLDKYNVPVDDLFIVDGVSRLADENTVGVHELVERDKSLLTASDGVLVGYSDVQSIGTPMEVMWAYERDYPIALWVRDATAKSAVSPWYLHHADIVTHQRDTAVEFLQEVCE